MNSTRFPEVVQLEYRSLDVSLSESFAISGGVAHQAELILVRVRDSDGNFGLGEAAPFPAYDGVTRDLILQSLEVTDYSTLSNWGNIDSSIVEPSEHFVDLGLPDLPGPLTAALEMAWLDLRCRQLGIPVHQLLGSEGQQPISGITVVVGDVDHARESATKYRDMGFRDLKIKLSGEVDLDIERIEAITQIDSQSRILLDANGAFSLAEARMFVAALESRQISITFLEQPLAAQAISEHLQLAQNCSFPLLADESCISTETFSRCLDEGGFAGVNLKTQKSGVFEAIRMHRMGLERGCRLMIGGMVESPLSMTLSAHMVIALGNFDWVDLDTPLFMAEHPFCGGIEFDRGVVKINEGPGLGISVDDDFIGFGSPKWTSVWQGERH